MKNKLNPRKFKNQKKSDLYKETNDKFVGRIENMLYYVCGCDAERGREVLEECLKRNKKIK